MEKPFLFIIPLGLHRNQDTVLDCRLEQDGPAADIAILVIGLRARRAVDVGIEGFAAVRAGNGAGFNH